MTGADVKAAPERDHAGGESGLWESSDLEAVGVCLDAEAQSRELRSLLMEPQARSGNRVHDSSQPGADAIQWCGRQKVELPPARRPALSVLAD